jgi:MFS family permease
MNVAEVATQINVPLGLAATFGAFSAGYLTDRFSHRNPNAVAIIPGVSLIACVPLYWIGFTVDSVPLALAVLLVANVLHYSYLGAQYTICQGVASARSRATAVAIMLFVVNLIGYGLGPLFVGFLSDALMTAAQSDMVENARAVGLAQSMMITVTIYALSGLLFLFTAKTLQRDLVSKLA